MYQLFKLKVDLHHIQLKNIKERRSWEPKATVWQGFP
jgi:hypothetical protein